MNRAGPPGTETLGGPDQNLQTERLTVYQHDIELIERFARENPDVIAKAPEKLVVCTVMYRCENFHIYFPGQYLGETITCPVCGGMMHPEA
jgi:hypothetical protein